MSPKTRLQTKPIPTFPNLKPTTTTQSTRNSTSPTTTIRSSNNNNNNNNYTHNGDINTPQLKKRPVNAYKSGEDPETIIVSRNHHSKPPSNPDTTRTSSTCSTHSVDREDDAWLLERYNGLCDRSDWIYHRAWKAFEQGDEGTLGVFTGLLEGYTPVNG